MYGIAWHTLIELRMHCYNLQDQKAKKLHVFGSEIIYRARVTVR